MNNGTIEKTGAPEVYLLPMHAIVCNSNNACLPDLAATRQAMAPETFIPEDAPLLTTPDTESRAASGSCATIKEQRAMTSMRWGL